MAPQVPTLEHIRRPQSTFFERFGFLGMYRLPAEVLDNTPLSDSETGRPQPSLRQRCSVDGHHCYACVLSSFADGLYWADVAATSDLAHAERVVLTETHLLSALTWDERLSALIAVFLMSQGGEKL